MCVLAAGFSLGCVWELLHRRPLQPPRPQGDSWRHVRSQVLTHSISFTIHTLSLHIAITQLLPDVIHTNTDANICAKCRALYSLTLRHAQVTCYYVYLLYLLTYSNSNPIPACNQYRNSHRITYLLSKSESEYGVFHHHDSWHRD